MHSIKCNIILIVSLVLLTVSIAQAQDEKKLKIGFQFTPEVTWLKAKSLTIENKGSKVGFNFGPVFDYSFGDNYAFTTGINISRSNGGLRYKDTTYFNSQPDKLYDKGSNVDYRLQYIEIPLALRLKTNEIGYMTYFGVFGLVPAINISAKGSFENSATPSVKIEPEKINKDVTLPNASMLISAGAAYSLSTNTSAFFSVNFYNGLIDVTRNPKGYKSKAIMNRVGLSLGIMF
jgi:hypothetical protein